MSYIRGTIKNNPDGVIYVKGSENANDSQRLFIDEKTGSLIVEKRTDGEWSMASMKHVQSFDKIITTEDGVVLNELGNFLTQS